MWSTETVWFDLAVVFGIFAFGNVLFGHFEEHKPKIRRVLKVALVSLVVALLSMNGLRWLAFSALGVLALGAVYVHGIWLPRHGINGLTGEPKGKYYDLLKVPEDRRPRWGGHG
jgi:predicted MFS family arabinose efflux permease